MRIKEGMGWKACHNEEQDVYGAEIMFQGSYALYEISADAFSRLGKNTGPAEAEALITEGRRLYSHVNDRCGPPYTVVLDDDYGVYCPWADGGGGEAKVWSGPMTDAAVELFDSEEKNRAQRRKKRERGS